MVAKPDAPRTSPCVYGINDVLTPEECQDDISIV